MKLSKKKTLEPTVDTIKKIYKSVFDEVLSKWPVWSIDHILNYNIVIVCWIIDNEEALSFIYTEYFIDRDAQNKLCK